MLLPTYKCGLKITVVAVISLLFSSLALAGKITINSGGSLKGSGDIAGDVVVQNGTLTPGISLGCLSVSELDYSAGGILNIELGGNTVCTEYDQVQVTGNLTLGSTLNVSLYNTYSLISGQSYTIIDNQGAASVSGIFNGLNEGALVAVGSKYASISYVGGDGNDVVLTALADQAITFGVIADQTFDTSSLLLSASTTSGLPVSYSSNTPAVCVESGNSLIFVTSGTCSITASQSGDSHYNAAPDVTQSFEINKANQTITFSELTNKTYGDASFALTASTDSGLAVSFSSSTASVCTVSGSNVTIVAAGYCSITASQTGDAQYLSAADVVQGFTVNKASNNITFEALPDKKIGDADFGLIATSDAGLTVTFNTMTTSVCAISGTTVTLVNIGTCTITAAQLGDTNHVPASDVSQSFNVLDNTVPVITLNGSATVSVTKGDSYIDAGAVATDNIDGDLTSNIVVTGSVDTNEIGIHLLSYDVSDTSGNAAATVIRTVTVVDSDFDGDGIGDFTDTDDDNDGVIDAEDAFPLDNAETTDTDGDGIGNNADNDDDNDGVIDAEDAFPLDNAETTDTDGDGIGNNADNDDDNDGIIDSEDNSPLDANAGDEQAPVFGVLPNLEFEASAPKTSVTLPEPEVTDNNVNTLVVTSDLPDVLTLGEHTITWTATDIAGNQSTAEQNVIIVDTTAPAFSELPTVELNASGRLTDITNFIDIKAVDLVDGEITAQALDKSNLRSGAHQVDITAIDTSGNIAAAQLDVIIYPELRVAPMIPVVSGGEFSLAFNLSGPAPNYPVDISYSLILSGEVISRHSHRLEKGTQDNLTGIIPATAMPDDEFNVLVDQVNNAFTDGANKAKLQVVEHNLAPSISVEVSQQGVTTGVIDPLGGEVVISATVNDINSTDRHQFSWDVVDNAFIGSSRRENDRLYTYSFDPSVLSPGGYAVELVVNEINTVELLSSSRTIQLVVESLESLKPFDDTDQDGINDSEEGYADSDSDGIADYLDDDSNTTRLPLGFNIEPMQTTTSISMSLGWLVKRSNGSESRFAAMTIEQFASLIAKMPGAADTNDSHFETISSLFDFRLTGLTQAGQSVSIVIPLPTQRPLPEGAIYRKYSITHGWFNFVEDANNTIASSPLSSNGLCPSPESADYSEGLTPGDLCMLLTIEDGGPNDADQRVNGVIDDPGAIVVEKQNQPPITEKDYAETTDNQSIVIDVLANDSDLDGDALTLIKASADHGTIVITNDNKLNYTPVSSYQGIASIIYLISDEFGGEAQGQVEITVSQTPVVEQPAPNKGSGGSWSILSLMVLFVVGLCGKSGLSPIYSKSRYDSRI